MVRGPDVGRIADVDVLKPNRPVDDQDVAAAHLVELPFDHLVVPGTRATYSSESEIWRLGRLGLRAASPPIPARRRRRGDESPNRIIGNTSLLGLLTKGIPRTRSFVKPRGGPCQ
jgi:hypothetical protein